MTQRYSVSGTLVPDATTADTGVSAGTHNDKPYWRWVVGEQEWFLNYITMFNRYGITDNLNPVNGWLRDAASEDPAGNYSPLSGATGTATVAEYVPPAPEKLLVLEWHVGPHAGKYTLLKEPV
jgi:hypothetical protein